MQKTTLSFKELVEKNPNTGKYSCLAMFVYGKKMDRELIERLLDRFVGKGEFSLSDKKSLLDHLVHLTHKL